MEGHKTRVSIPRTKKWLIFSNINQQPYQIYVSKPKEPAPPAGYPVIYVLDGNAFFQTFQEATRLQAKRSEKTGIEPCLIVGIGYPVDEDFVSTRRVYDFTPPGETLDLPTRPDGRAWPKAGGAGEFYHFLKDELIPEMNRLYPINRRRQTLFGHSLGGLFTLYSMFTDASLFQTYIATSPSIWWNNRCINKFKQYFLAEFQKVNQDIGVFLAVGSLEKDFMIEQTKELSQQLLQQNTPHLSVEYQLIEGENHISVVPTVLSRALRYVCQYDAVCEKEQSQKLPVSIESNF